MFSVSQEMRAAGCFAVCLCVGLTVGQQAVDQAGNGTSGDGSSQGARTGFMNPNFMSSMFAKITESLSGVFQGMPGMPSSNGSSSAGMFGNFGNMFGIGPPSNSTQGGNPTGGGFLPGGGMPSPMDQMQDMFSMMSPMLGGQRNNGTSEGQGTARRPGLFSPGAGTASQGPSTDPYGKPPWNRVRQPSMGVGRPNPYYAGRRQMVVLPYLLRPVKVVPGNGGGLVQVEEQQHNGSVAAMTNRSQGAAENKNGSQPPPNNPLSGFPSMYDANGRPVGLDGMMVAMPVVMGNPLGARGVSPGLAGTPLGGAPVALGTEDVPGGSTNGSSGETPNVLPPQVATGLESYLSSMIQGYMTSLRRPFSRAPPPEEVKPKPLFCREFDCPPFEVLERGEVSITFASTQRILFISLSCIFFAIYTFQTT